PAALLRGGRLAVTGYTSLGLRQEFVLLRKMPGLWTRSYVCGTAGWCPAPQSNGTRGKDIGHCHAEAQSIHSRSPARCTWVPIAAARAWMRSAMAWCVA